MHRSNTDTAAPAVGIDAVAGGAIEPILSAAFRTSRDALILFRADDELIIDVNAVWCATTGLRREDVIGKSQKTLNIWADADSRRFADLMRAEGEVRDFRFSFHRTLPNGRHATGHASLAAQPIVLDGATYFLVSGRDVTAEVEGEQRRQQSHRLEELGRLAGGVAHDFNNILTVIGAYAVLARDVAVTGTVPDPEDLQEIIRASARAADLTKRLLAFSRHQVVEPRPVDLNAAVEDATRMLGRVVGENVALATDLDPRIPPVLADPMQLAQVLLNLAVNARDAMPSGGRLSIRTCAGESGEPGGGGVSGSRATTRPHVVLLEVGDNGTGMDEETCARIFEPFFTTKSPDIGTGLGLAVVYGIVHQSGATIEVDSAVGAGTTFRIRWPVAVEVPAIVTPDESSSMTPRSGRGCILLTEDDARVRAAVARMLKDRGYAVIEASNGADALSVIEGDRESIDAVVTDLVMPVMGGRELAERLGDHAPHIPVVFMSGYTDGGGDVRGGLANVRVPVITKPFEAETLVRAIESARTLASR